jgi:hypothetical protein
MKAILCMSATGIIAFAIVELLEHWRRYRAHKNRRPAIR